MGIMEGKTCVITGGGGSLGLESAKLMLNEGAKILLVDNNQDKLTKAVDALNSVALNGGPDLVASAVADVSDSQETRNYMEQAVRKWGAIDVLFSNAGISGIIRPITEFPEEVFDRVMKVNVRSTFLACKYGIPCMSDGGSIIITSSVVGVTSDPGICAYATSKHALIGLMRTVAKETAGRGIRVNVVCPGPIENDFQAEVETGLSKALRENATEFLNKVIPLGRHGMPEEIARTVLFLASDQSSFSTGSIFMADGGMNI